MEESRSKGEEKRITERKEKNIKDKSKERKNVDITPRRLTKS